MELIRKLQNKVLNKLVSWVGIGPLLINKNKISVLTYHGITGDYNSVNDFCFVSAGEFEKQMKYLLKHFDIIGAEDAYLNNYDNKKPVAVITFDDGFFNNFSHAFPVLKKYKIPATVFLSTNLIESNDTIWFCKIIQMIESSKEKEIFWEGEKLSIDSCNDKRLTSSKIQASIKKLNPSEIESAINKIFKLGDIYTDYSDTLFGMLTRNAIKEMQDSHLITFGAHTHNHTILSKLSKDESQKEISDSLQEVQKITGKRCNMFAYPNGGVDDYNSDHKSLLNKLNVSLAFSMKDGLSSRQDDYFEIKRLFISSHINIKQFSAQVHGY